MSWVIVLLLALILIAVMASDKAASRAVKQVIRYAAIGAAFLAAALALLAFLIWFHVGYADEDWWQTGGMVSLALVGLGLLWISRKDIKASYKRDKWSVLRPVAAVFFFLALGLLFGAAWKSLALSGWWLLAVPLGISSVVLLVRTAAGPKKWREVWTGPVPSPDPWDVLQDARMQAEASEEATWAQESAHLKTMIASEREAVRERRVARITAMTEQLASVHEAAKEVRAMELARESSGSARSVFWTSLFLCGLGLIPVIWRFGFDWAMTLEWVKGKEWKAGALVIVGALAVIGIVVSIFEEASKPKGRDG